MTTYMIGNVERMSREGRGLEIPPVEWREDLQPGDLAKLMLLSEQLPPEEAWVEVRDILGPGTYLGMTETGDSVEFDARNVMDIEMPGLDRPPYAIGNEPGSRMGDVFDWLEKTPRKPSIFEYEERAAQQPPEAPKGPKRSFWDIFKRKPKTELMPIPPEERRGAEVRPGLPRPEVVRERPRPTVEVPPEAEAPPEIIAPPVIIPPAPAAVPLAPEPVREATPGGLVVLPPEETAVYHYPEPISYFDILGPTAPPAAPRGLIVPEVSPPTLPAAPADVWSVLEPAPERGMVVRSEMAPVVAPEPAVYDVLIPAPPAMEVTPFDVLGPEEPGALVVRPSMEPTTVFDVLAPEQALAPYVPPEERALSPFEVMAPAEPLPEVEVTWGGVPVRPIEPKPTAAPTPKKKKKPKAPPRLARLPTVDEWIDFIRQKYDLEKVVWPYLRSTRVEPEYKEMQLREDDTGLPATIPIETVQSWDWPDLAESLGLSWDLFEPYVKAMDEESEKLGYPDEAWQKFQEELIEPISEGIHAAFERLKPKDIPGHIFLGEDGQTEGQTYGIVYYEALKTKERKKLEREMEELQELAAKATREATQKLEALSKRRDEELRRVWGRMPTAKELVPWVEGMYGDNFWRMVQKERKSPGFKREMAEQFEFSEPAVMELDKIAEEGPKLYDQISSYFAIPPDVFNVYLRDDDEDLLWDDFLSPFFEVITEAFDRVKPKNIPGTFEVQWDDAEEDLFLKYLEDQED